MRIDVIVTIKSVKQENWIFTKSLKITRIELIQILKRLRILYTNYTYQLPSRYTYSGVSKVLIQSELKPI